MRLDIYVKHGDEKVELDSKKYPKNLFKIGYFRSSYNEGGINRVLAKTIGTDLYDIFEYKEGENEFTPNWKKALTNTKNAIADLKNVISKKSFIDVMCVPMDKPKVSSETEALKLYVKEMSERVPFNAFSDKSGFYTKEPIKVKAIIQGENRYGSKCAYIIIARSTNELVDYLQELEIVQETIEYVLNQKQPSDYSMYWSR